MTEDLPARAGVGRLPWWALVPLAGLAWWVAGFLPWLAESFLEPALPSAVDVWLSVPLLAGSLGELLAGGLLGGLVAGLLGCTARRGSRWPAVAATAAGVALALTVTLVHSGAALRDAGGFDGDSRVLLGLRSLVVLAALAGWAVGSCWAFGRPGLGVALVVLGAVVPGWVNGVLHAAYAAFQDPRFGYPTIDGWWALAAGAAVMAAGLVVIGVRPPVRLAWWPPALLVAWFVGPALTAAVFIEVYLRPGGGLPGSLPEALAATEQVFGEAALPANRPLWPWLAAVAVGAVVAGLLPRLRPPTGPRDERTAEVDALPA